MRLILSMAPSLGEIVRLLLVTDDGLLSGRYPLGVCRAAVEGGVTAVELRLKESSPRDLLALARRLIAALPVPVIINDRVDVALAAGAAGVHLGPDDLPVRLARRTVPEGFIVGASVGAESEMENGRGADYWGIGPWRETSTKAEAGLALGEEGFGRLCARSGGIPCVAIGGVRPEDVPAVLSAGGAGVAVASAILSAPDPTAAAQAFVGQIRLARRPEPC
jgi:thiamine-phosphate pyrophosphorylase